MGDRWSLLRWLWFPIRFVMKGRTPTEFEEKVYAALCRVPKGKVTTYKALAAVVECGSPRAVGGAMRRNPFAPEVPCHRVLNARLELNGYDGQTEGEGLRRKKELLESEGVAVDDDGRVAREFLVERF